MCQWVFQERHTSTLASDLLYQRGIGHSGHGDSPLPSGQADDSNLFTPTPTLTLPHQGGGIYGVVEQVQRGDFRQTKVSQRTSFLNVSHQSPCLHDFSHERRDRLCHDMDSIIPSPNLP